MAEKRISHEGIVEGMSGNRVRVRITSHSACSSCHAKGACQISEATEKRLNVPSGGSLYRTGEKVQVILAQSQGFRALFLGYILPFLLVLATLLAMSGISDNELVCGAVSISVLIPYYLVLGLCKNRIDRHFSFTVNKI